MLPLGNVDGLSASFSRSVARISRLIKNRTHLLAAFVAMLAASGSSLLTPVIIGYAIDAYIRPRNAFGLIICAVLLLGVNLSRLFASYAQAMAMGRVGRDAVFTLRSQLFAKLQELPLEVLYRNKTGDLMSRISDHTDKVNDFFTQGLVQLTGNMLLAIGAGSILLLLNTQLALCALLPALSVFAVTRWISHYAKQWHSAQLQALSGMSGKVQEIVVNVRPIAFFDRSEYFWRKFNDANEENCNAGIKSALLSAAFTPAYGLAFNLAQMTVLLYGIHLIALGRLTIGLLIGLLFYVNGLYTPLRQVAATWQTFQLALAALDRIYDILAVESDMPVIHVSQPMRPEVALEFRNVGFRYPGGHDVLTDASFIMLPGRTYALVGPTGGGKTTTASLMTRLYDPTEGEIFLNGRDIRSYSAEERACKVGLVLQEPFLFTGAVCDNLIYGNPKYQRCSTNQLMSVLNERRMSDLVGIFPLGLHTKVDGAGTGISLGQKQIVAFMRAVLRDPEILIFDEASANVDSMTEQKLNKIIETLPLTTTKVVIAHRLNTIAKADEILFVNCGTITPAASLTHALDLLFHSARIS